MYEIMVFVHVCNSVRDWLRARRQGLDSGGGRNFSLCHDLQKRAVIIQTV